MKTFPRVIFQYSKERDIANINIGLDGVRGGRMPDGALIFLMRKYGDAPTPEEIKEHLDEVWKDKEHIKDIIVSQMQEYWDTIEERFFAHLADRMQLESFYDVENLQGFLSTRWGSGYDSQENWFAFSAHYGTLKNAGISMHEIMHIFFHKQWWQFCKEQKLEEKNIWDVKEAMTVLLNLWFKNQLIDLDSGYEEHVELRKYIQQWFLESKDFKNVLIKACVYMREHKEKSPIWIK